MFKWLVEAEKGLIKLAKKALQGLMGCSYDILIHINGLVLVIYLHMGSESCLLTLPTFSNNVTLKIPVSKSFDYIIF